MKLPAFGARGQAAEVPAEGRAGHHRYLWLNTNLLLGSYRA